MAKTWGDGTPTRTLHRLSFDMYENLASDLGCVTYRKLPVLSVSPGYDEGGSERARKSRDVGPLIPDWLDGNVGRISPMGVGDDTAQITPFEFVGKMIEGMAGDDVEVILGTCTGIDTEDEKEGRRITGVRYVPRIDNNDDEKEREELTVPADSMVVSAGPWSCQAEDWFDGALELPMEGIKSTSIVWERRG